MQSIIELAEAAAPRNCHFCGDRFLHCVVLAYARADVSGDFECLLSKYVIQTEFSVIEPQIQTFILHRSLWRY